MPGTRAKHLDRKMGIDIGIEMVAGGCFGGSKRRNDACTALFHFALAQEFVTSPLHLFKA
jgi:hypothetical protein